jgi:hypothetical protein
MGINIIKCTNCGAITRQEHMLPLCDDCFKGLEDYENFIARSLLDCQINIDRVPRKRDDFLRV